MFVCINSVCTYLCVCESVYVCVHVYACACTCRCVRVQACMFFGTQAQVRGPYLLLIFASHLRRGLLVFTSVLARPAGLRASGEHSASASHLDIGTLALQTIPQIVYGLWGFELRFSRMCTKGFTN